MLINKFFSVKFFLSLLCYSIITITMYIYTRAYNFTYMGGSSETIISKSLILDIQSIFNEEALGKVH